VALRWKAAERKNQTIHRGKSKPLEDGGVLRDLAGGLHVKEKPSLNCGFFLKENAYFLNRIQGTK
jgi:hypothetical protein